MKVCVNASFCSIMTCDVLTSSASVLSPVQRGQVLEQKNNQKKGFILIYISIAWWSLNKRLDTLFVQILKHSSLKVFESRAQLWCLYPFLRKLQSPVVQGTFVIGEMKPLSELSLWISLTYVSWSSSISSMESMKNSQSKPVLCAGDSSSHSIWNSRHSWWSFPFPNKHHNLIWLFKYFKIPFKISSKAIY